MVVKCLTWGKDLRESERLPVISMLGLLVELPLAVDIMVFVKRGG